MRFRVLYRLFFPASIAPGTRLTVPSLGQDPNALLISFRAQPIFTGAPVRYWVFGLPKPTVYAGGSVSFNTFEVAGDVAAATNAGFLFGGYSATTIDVLRATNGGCAATVQQYFTTGGTWKTRIARLGACPAQ